ncbi:MAG: TlpA disulfide reductase family protein [Planctomycetota bacterium]
MWVVCLGEEESWVGKKAPDFKLMDCDGNDLSLAQFVGKVVVLNFWRTTCFPCLEEMPDLQQIHEEYKDKGVVVIGLAVNDKAPDVDNKVTVMGIRYPVALDNMATRLTYKINSVPHTFIIDKEGTIRAHFGEQTNKKAIEDAIAPLLVAPPAKGE